MFASLCTPVPSRKSVFTDCLHLGHVQMRDFRGSALVVATFPSLFLIPDTQHACNRAGIQLVGIRQGPKHTSPPAFRNVILIKGAGGGRAAEPFSQLPQLKSCLWRANFLSSFTPKNPGWMLPTHNGKALLLLTCRISVASGFTSPL